MIVSQSRKAGMFAELTTVIRHIKYVRDRNLKLFIDWNKNNSLYYDEKYGNNVWEFFFEKIDGEFDQNNQGVLNDYIDISNLPGLNIRQTFNKIYHDNVKLNKKTSEIIKEETYKVNNKTLGIHIRKTDKFLCEKFNEPMALPINDDLVFKIIDNLGHKYEKIYLATDCQETYENFYKNYKSVMIKNDRIRGLNNIAIHTKSDENNYTKGLESLIDSYVLSECGFLIRSTSNLSSFSMFLNLNLECININEIFRNDFREHEFNIKSIKYEY
jgi:hypothetical protein